MTVAQSDQPLIVYRPSNGEWLRFDACLGEDYAPTWELAAHPVEGGRAVVDDAIAAPEEIAVRGMITESPWSTTDGGALAGTSGPARVRAAVRFLAAAAGERVTLGTTRHGQIGDLRIVRFAHTIDRQRRALFDITLRKVTIAAGDTVTIPAAKPPAKTEAGVATAADLGAQPGTVADPDSGADPQATRDRSAAYAIAQAVGLR